MNFHRTNYNTYEAQNFVELASHSYERPINVLEFIFAQNRSNNFDKIKPHMVKLISIDRSIVFLDLKFYSHEYMTKIEFRKYSQIFLSKETIYHN